MPSLKLKSCCRDIVYDEESDLELSEESHDSSYFLSSLSLNTDTHAHTHTHELAYVYMCLYIFVCIYVYTSTCLYRE